MNKFIGIGRFTKNPELKQTTSGKTVCSFGLAIKKRFSDGTDFLDFEAWESTAEFICRYFQKGDMIGIVGRVETKEWEQDEKKHRKVIIIVEEANFCGTKKSDDSTQHIETNSGVINSAVVDESDLPF